MKSKKYLYYDDPSGEWKPATLDDLAFIDNPELRVCVLDEDGTPGPQTSYGQIVRQSRPLPPVPKPANITPSQPPPTPVQSDLSSNNDLILRYTLRYVSAVLTFVVFALCVIIGQLSGHRDGAVFGFIAGAVLACCMYYRARSASKSSKI